jgi:hypothetical protein
VDGEKRCAFCDYHSGDPSEFADHVRAAHPGFFESTTRPRQRGIPYEGGLRVFALLVGGFCGYVALLLPNIETAPTLRQIPAIYLDWLRTFGQFLIPLATLLAFFFPQRSYRWGLVIGWAMLPVSAFYTGLVLLGTLLGPFFGLTDTAENLVAAFAYFAAPALLVGVLCAVAWAAAALRRRFRPE